MKHTDFKTVQRYVQEIEAINLDLVHVTGGGSGLGVTIQGRYQDDTIVNQVRPVVVGILQRAKAERILALMELAVRLHVDAPVDDVLAVMGTGGEAQRLDQPAAGLRIGEAGGVADIDAHRRRPIPDIAS